MNNEPTGRNTLRSIRIPDDLWSRVEAWSGERGDTPSDGVRALLQIGLSAPAPDRVIPIIAPLKWMLSSLAVGKQRHECAAVVLRDDPKRTLHREKMLRMRSACEGSPCPQAWKRRPDEWLLARATRRTALGEWDGVERLLALEGAVELPGGSQGSWVAVPLTSYSALAATFSDYPRAVSVHALKAATS